jgi:hypothetical protein
MPLISTPIYEPRSTSPFWCPRASRSVGSPFFNSTATPCFTGREILPACVSRAGEHRRPKILYLSDRNILIDELLIALPFSIFARASPNCAKILSLAPARSASGLDRLVLRSHLIQLWLKDESHLNERSAIAIPKVVGKPSLIIGGASSVIRELSLIVGDVPNVIGELSLIIGELPKILGRLSSTLGEASLIIGELSLTIGASLWLRRRQYL